MSKNLELTILMPCLNEAETIASCIKKAKQSLINMNIDGEILISDNGSTDGSQKIARDLGARVISVKEKDQGYGSGIRWGVNAARGKYVIMGDSDDSYDFSRLEPFVEKLREGFELVMGNRFKGGIEKDAMPFLHRYLGNPVLSKIGKLFFGVKINDFNCGLRGFTKEAFLRINPQTRGMDMASEIVVKAALNKLKITEVPTTLSPDGRSREPHLNTWSDGWKVLRFLLVFSPKWLFLYPGIILSVVSFIFGAFLFIGTVQLQSIGFDVKSLIYTSFAFIIGVQLLFFYFFAKIYSVSNHITPMSDRFLKSFDYVSLEKGIIAGALLFIAGILLALKNLLGWSEVDFGLYDDATAMRYVLLSAIMITIGVQMVIYSFVYSIIGLKIRLPDDDDNLNHLVDLD